MNEPAPRVRRCHVNVWSLPSIIIGRRLFYFDVGVEVVAGDVAVSEVQMLLPFRVEPGAWPDGAPVAQDLFPHISNRDAAELIFGGPVTVNDDGAGNMAIKVGDYDELLQLRRIKSHEVAEVEGRAARDDSSLYTVPLDRPVEPGERGYFRVRWRVFGAAPLWRWKRLTGSARFDLRFYDVRESPWADSDFYLRKRMMPIEELNVFLVAPARYELATSSPTFRHLRVLEPGAWRGYLRGAAHFNRIGELLVYYWRAKSKGDDRASGALPLGDTQPTGPGPDVAPAPAQAGVAGPASTDTAAREDLQRSGADEQERNANPVGTVNPAVSAGASTSDPPVDVGSSIPSSAATPPARAALRIDPEPTDAVHFDSPFRVFVALARPNARVWWLQILLVAAGVLVANWVINLFGHISDIHSVKWATIATFIVGGTAVSIITAFERIRRASASHFLRTRLAVRRLERRLLLVNK